MPSTAPRQPQDSCPHAWSPNIPKTAQTSLCVTGGHHAHHWEMSEAGHVARLVSSGARTAACTACYGSSRAHHRPRHTLCTSPLLSAPLLRQDKICWLPLLLSCKHPQAMEPLQPRAHRGAPREQPPPAAAELFALARTHQQCQKLQDGRKL